MNTRDPAQHTCPWLNMTPSMRPDCPRQISIRENDVWRFSTQFERNAFHRLGRLAIICFPTSVEPVKAILSTSGCSTSGAPAVSPNPGTMLITPAGKPASSINSAKYNADSGVCSAGFRTTVHPVARAAPNFHIAIRSGKFQGIICPTTPTAS